MNRFYSSGKLLITGEYLVLNGAKALAVPLIKGQEMQVFINGQTEGICWESFYQDKMWMKAIIDPETFELEQYSGEGDGNYLKRLFLAVKELNPDFLNEKKPFTVVNKLDFSPDWGLGSSSSLISNLSFWAEINPFVLNGKVSKGSGYDIATARSKTPILYRVDGDERIINPVDFYPSFSDHLFLVWLGNKKGTEQSVNWYRKYIRPTKKQIRNITNLTNEIWQTDNSERFGEILKEHNSIMEEILHITSVQNLYFNDFEGVIKPLGAWGGDFILVVASFGEHRVKSYFQHKGLSVIFKWDELVKGKETV
ncbi:MAG: hypothetical protein JXR31_13035 [Prolixibacteraceae bacterium]|nr:hypothetical protein [Prolixibacteraceae bacterium]MBN2775174.1 hypothetical protein [Prolixibacteraceae bacterium]